MKHGQSTQIILVATLLLFYSKLFEF